jgi:hypothetical protein
MPTDELGLIRLRTIGGHGTAAIDHACGRDFVPSHEGVVQRPAREPPRRSRGLCSKLRQDGVVHDARIYGADLLEPKRITPDS